MRKITEKMIWGIEMFSKEGWAELNKEVPTSKYRWAEPETLADGYIEFCRIWQEDHDIEIDYLNPEIKTFRGEEVQTFLDWNSDKTYYYDGNLEEDLRTRYAEYLLGD